MTPSKTRINFDDVTDVKSALQAYNTILKERQEVQPVWRGVELELGDILVVPDNPERGLSRSVLPEPVTSLFVNMLGSYKTTVMHADGWDHEVEKRYWEEKKCWTRRAKESLQIFDPDGNRVATYGPRGLQIESQKLDYFIAHMR